MTENPGGSTEREGFSDDIAQLIVAVRALIGGHWDLFRAELGAISRDAVGVLLGAIAVITLVTAALLALLIAIFMLLGAAFFGSMIWGAAHVTLLLLVVAAAITSAIPTWAAIASAVVRLSPLSMITRTPRRRSRATACSASGLTVSATAITPRI